MEYCSSLLLEIVAAIDSIGGESLVRGIMGYGIGRRAADNLMTILRVDPSELKGLPPARAAELLARLLRREGGPEISFQVNEGEIVAEVSECHFMPWAARHPLFCRITASFLESVARSLAGGRWSAEEVQTIAHGGDRCVFRLRSRD